MYKTSSYIGRALHRNRAVASRRLVHSARHIAQRQLHEHRQISTTSRDRNFRRIRNLNPTRPIFQQYTTMTSSPSTPATSVTSDPHPLDDVAHEQLFTPVIHRILEAFEKSMPSSPPHDPANPEPFLAYWRSKFSHLHNEIVNDESIPDHVTEPPSTTFEVRLFDQPSGLRCPCCMPAVPPGLLIRKEAGVRKGDLVLEIGQWLFGKEVPTVYQQDDYGEYDDSEDGDEVAIGGETQAEEEDVQVAGGNEQPAAERAEGEVRAGDSWIVDNSNQPGNMPEFEINVLDEGHLYEEVKEEKKRVVLYHSDWMNGVVRPDGGWLDENKTWLYGSVPEIWLYGCSMEDFGERKRGLKEQDDAQAKVDEEDEEERARKSPKADGEVA